MSDREYAIHLLDTVPDNEIAYVIGFIQGLTAKNRINSIEEAKPDEWDLAMIEEAEKENDGATMSLEELLEKDGLTYEDLQDRI